MEDPIRNNCLEPQSLVLMPTICFYCACQDEKMVEVFPNFGILSCLIHYSHAIRDCNAYKHRSKIVAITDAIKKPNLKGFMKLLESGFPVLRSSGLVDPGWVVNTKTSCGVGEYISYSLEKGCWLLPALKPSDSSSKHININDLLLPEIVSSLPENINVELIQFLNELNKGVYLADSLMYDSLVDKNKPTVVEDLAEIRNCLSSNGQQGRVLFNP